MQKLSKNSQSHHRGVAPSPPEYATTHALNMLSHLHPSVKISYNLRRRYTRWDVKDATLSVDDCCISTKS